MMNNWPIALPLVSRSGLELSSGAIPIHVVPYRQRIHTGGGESAAAAHSAAACTREKA